MKNMKSLIVMIIVTISNQKASTCKNDKAYDAYTARGGGGGKKTCLK